MPTLQVSDYVKAELDDIKTTEEHKSYDSVLRSLIGSYEHGQ